jgi:hypothetical protein
MELGVRFREVVSRIWETSRFGTPFTETAIRKFGAAANDVVVGIVKLW